MSGRSGFTLVEILVALVVLQLGLLGVAGTLVLASRVLTRARDLEWAVHEVRSVADSLGRFGMAGGGERALDFGRVAWTGTPGSGTVEVRIQAWRAGAALPVVDVIARVPSATPAP